MLNKRINSVEERREFVQDIIDRLLYLDHDNREKFINSVQGTVRKFKLPVTVDNDGTRVYRPVAQ
ncbi:hypothetical protein EBT25_10350 [bacterium]|jgi:hypothetical protein|nr:hypothetical protein [bacterium]